MEEIVFTSELEKENIQRFLKKNLLRIEDIGDYPNTRGFEVFEVK